MENLLSVQFSWTYLFTMSLFLLALFFALQFVEQILQRISFPGKWQAPVKRAVRYLLLVYEPLALILAGGIFVLIYPIFHGLLLALVFLSAFTQLRNYIAGRVIQTDHLIDRGSRLRTGAVEGVVLKMGRLGMQVQTKEGLYHLTYSHLLATGYTLISGEEIGGFYQLRISPKENENRTRHQQQLQQLLVTAPYLDWNHKPEITALDDDGRQLEARVLVREESHLHDLIALIREYGYNCVLAEQ